MARDLKDPAGCRSSSLRKMRQLARRERALDSTRGVSIHGVFVGGRKEPMMNLTMRSSREVAMMKDLSRWFVVI